MYRPAMFREDRPEILHALMRAHPLATLVTAGSQGLEANLLPFLLAEVDGAWVLRAHLGRANGQLAALREGGPALVIFQGPDAYVSPAWYPSKAEHGKVVPTWNYATVQARGTPRVIEDAAWLRAQIEALTGQQEAGREAPWQVGDAPQDFIEATMRAIIGLEIPIDSLEGKWKVSQNRGEADRAGVVAGLRREGARTGDGEAMAMLVTQGGGAAPAA